MSQDEKDKNGVKSCRKREDYRADDLPVGGHLDKVGEVRKLPDSDIGQREEWQHDKNTADDGKRYKALIPHTSP